MHWQIEVGRDEEEEENWEDDRERERERALSQLSVGAIERAAIAILKPA